MFSYGAVCLFGIGKALSEPVFRDKDVHIDNITMRDNPTHDVVHLQFQDSMERSNNGLHLTNNTCSKNKTNH